MPPQYVSLQTYDDQIILSVNVRQPRFCERRRFNLSEWELIASRAEEYPGISGVQFHKKDATRGNSPWPPEGMTAAEILAVPGAKAYWGTIAEVEAYLSFMEQALQEDVGEIEGNYYDYVCEEWEDVDDDSDENRQGDEDEVRVLVSVIID